MSDFNQQEYLQTYTAQDKRLQTPRAKKELIANNRGLNFERLSKIGRGVREIHEVQILGETVPMRVVSMGEERILKQQTYIELNQYPDLKNDSLEFNRIYLKKQLSLATSACMEASENNSQDRYFTEEDIDALPPSTFAALVTAYQALELEYNPSINEISEEAINLLIQELMNPQKKSLLLPSLTFSQHRAITNRLLEMWQEREEVISTTLLSVDTSQQPKSE